MIADEQVAAVLHTQKMARQQGSAQMAVEVYGWAIKHAMSLTKQQLAELLDIVGKEPE